MDACWGRGSGDEEHAQELRSGDAGGVESIEGWCQLPYAEWQRWQCALSAPPPIRITALRNDVQHSLPPDAPISPAPYELLSSHAYTDSRTHELESLQNLFMVNGFPINKTVGGLSAKGEVMPGGLEQLSTYLNGTDSHENSHEVCPRPRRKAQALAIGAAPPLPSAFLTP